MPLNIPDNYRVRMTEMVCDQCASDFHEVSPGAGTNCPLAHCKGRLHPNGDYHAYIRYIREEDPIQQEEVE